MKRKYVDSYQCKAMSALVAVTGKPKQKQPVRKFKPYRLAMIKKLAAYVSVAGWKA